MAGALNMNSEKIKNLDNPSDQADVVNKNYSESQLHDYLNRSEGINCKMETDLHMDGYKLVNVGAPAANTDTTNKQYVDTGLATKLDAIPQSDFNMNNNSIVNLAPPPSWKAQPINSMSTTTV